MNNEKIQAEFYVLFGKQYSSTYGVNAFLNLDRKPNLL